MGFDKAVENWTARVVQFEVPEKPPVYPCRRSHCDPYVIKAPALQQKVMLTNATVDGAISQVEFSYGAI